MQNTVLQNMAVGINRLVHESMIDTERERAKSTTTYRARTHRQDKLETKKRKRQRRRRSALLRRSAAAGLAGDARGVETAPVGADNGELGLQTVFGISRLEC